MKSKESPKRSIKHGEEDYIFVGFTKDTSEKGKKDNQILLENNGRRVIFKEYKGNPDVLCIYASNRFASRLNKAIKPMFGKGKITEDE